VQNDALESIASRVRATPRTANYILKRIRDYAQVQRKVVDSKLVDEVMQLLEIDRFGLTEQDRKLLRTIMDNFKGGPVGLNTLAAALAEEEETIENVSEPYLLQIGMLERTSRGRVVTDKAIDHLRSL
jgi:Holliday junction DNA helicase RuvB